MSYFLLIFFVSKIFNTYKEGPNPDYRAYSVLRKKHTISLHEKTIITIIYCQKNKPSKNMHVQSAEYGQGNFGNENV
jgi:hypothetical protein